MDNQERIGAEGSEEHELHNYEEAAKEVGDEGHEVEAGELAHEEVEERQDVKVSSQRGRTATGERQRQRVQKTRRQARRRVRHAVQIPEEEPLEERLRSYELLYLVDAALDREEIDRTAAEIVQRIEQGGGYAENVRVSEVRRLEYPIKKRTHGIYVLVNFKAPPSVAKELGTFLRFNERVLRHLLILTKQRAELE